MAGMEGKNLGRYTLNRLAGRGGMADVYEGYDPKFQRKVAVKVFKREDEEMLQRFIREARLMGSLSNDHLVPIYDTGTSLVDGVTWYYIVMPFMEGGTLRARIRRSPLSLPEACRAMSDIASALDYIHSQGIIHRDIKASNVLLDSQGKCYLADFGIARTTTDATQLTTTGNVLGTVEYVAPELFEVDRKADARSDLYSLGVLLYEMVTGRLPFYAENPIALVTMHMNKRPPSPRTIAPQISPAVERVIMKALEKKPEQRYGSASELANAFCRATGNKNGSRQNLVAPPATVVASPTPVLHVAQDQLVLGPVPQAVYPSPMAPVTDLARMPAEVRRGRPTPLPSPARRRTWVVAMLALLTLLVISIPIAFAVTQRNGTPPAATVTGQGQIPTTASTPTDQPTPTATPNATATARAAATATVVAQVHATSTAIAGATATVQVQASATAGVVQTATAGKATYKDALIDATNPKTQAAGWDQNSQCAFAADGYHVKEGVNLVNLHGCRESNNPYQNMAVSVDVTLLSGHSGGLFFRLHTDTFGNYTGYLFEVDTQGNYKISNFAGGAPSALQDWTASPALKKGLNVKNTLQVIAKGGTLLFYANGAYLGTQTDSSYTDGTVAFLATTTDTPADVVYSNLSVHVLT